MGPVVDCIQAVFTLLFAAVLGLVVLSTLSRLRHLDGRTSRSWMAAVADPVSGWVRSRPWQRARYRRRRRVVAARLDRIDAVLSAAEQEMARIAGDRDGWQSW